MTRRLLMLTLLLTLETGCPHAFGKGGTIDMALRKDMDAERKARGLVFPCKMPADKWRQLCSTENGRKPSVDCPDECRPIE